MNDIVREWVTKAEGDLRTAIRELAAAEGPNYDAVCFHAQQCVEKLMKAVLIQVGKQVPRTHDLVRLDILLREAVPSWSWPLPDLRMLDRAAVAFRYPGESADVDEARAAVEMAELIREPLMKLLSL